MEQIETEEVAFNYFYQLFLRDVTKKKLEKARSRIPQGETDPDDLVELVFFEATPKEEMLAILNDALLEVCNDYVVLSNTELDSFPEEPFEFVNLILDTQEENPYRDSFLKSLPHIYQEYYGCFGNGIPYLMGSFDKKLIPCFTINLNHLYQIINFDINNIDLLEQDKIMTRLVSMEAKGQIGPVPKVRMLVKPDPILKVIHS